MAPCQSRQIRSQFAGRRIATSEIFPFERFFPGAQLKYLVWLGSVAKNRDSLAIQLVCKTKDFGDFPDRRFTRQVHRLRHSVVYVSLESSLNANMMCGWDFQCC